MGVTQRRRKQKSKRASRHCKVIRAGPRIGPEYQASISDAASTQSPEFLQEHSDREWSAWIPEPSSLSRDVDAYLEGVKDPRFPREGALVLLFYHNYNIKHAVEELPTFVPIPKEDRKLPVATIRGIGNGEAGQPLVEGIGEDALLRRRSQVPNCWTEVELARFIKSLHTHGKDFAAIARDLGTKSENFIRDFYNNYAEKYDLDAFVDSSSGSRNEGSEETVENVVKRPESALAHLPTPEPVSASAVEGVVRPMTATSLAHTNSESMSNSSVDAMRLFSSLVIGKNRSTKENYAPTTQWHSISSESDYDKENWYLQNAVRDRAEVGEVQMKGERTAETEVQSKDTPGAVFVAAAAMTPYQSRQRLKSPIHGELQGLARKGRMTC